MFHRVLLTNKLRIAAAGVASVMLATVVLPVAVVYADAVPAAGDKNVSAGEVQNALTHDSGILNASDQVNTTSDSDSALKATVGGATIDVPKDASDGVTLGTANGPKLDIQLPNASQDTNAKKIDNGVVAYAGDNGSANAVQATEDGGVRMLTIIDNPTAPTTYDYKVSVPNGGHIELVENGGAVILDNKSAIIASVAAPWAHDATGKAIATYFTIDGTTLTQHIRHNVPGVVYPVTADPSVSFGWFAIYITLSASDQHDIVTGGSAVAAAVVCTYFTDTVAIRYCVGIGALVATLVANHYNPRHSVQLKFSWFGRIEGIRTL